MVNEKEQHTVDANKALEDLKGKTGEHIEFRRECINELLVYLETGKIDHVNPNIDHFK